jgi:hypothetical protein
MTGRLLALCFDANDPAELARFWSGVLGRESRDVDGAVVLLPNDDTGFQIRFTSTQQPKFGPNQMHLDLTSTSTDDQQQTAARGGPRGAGRSGRQRVLHRRAGATRSSPTAVSSERSPAAAPRRSGTSGAPRWSACPVSCTHRLPTD